MCIRDLDKLNLIWQFGFRLGPIFISQKIILESQVVKSDLKIMNLLLLWRVNILCRNLILRNNINSKWGKQLIRSWLKWTPLISKTSLVTFVSSSASSLWQVMGVKKTSGIYSIEGLFAAWTVIVHIHSVSQNVNSLILKCRSQFTHNYLNGRFF